MKQIQGGAPAPAAIGAAPEQAIEMGSRNNSGRNPPTTKARPAEDKSPAVSEKSVPKREEPKKVHNNSA